MGEAVAGAEQQTPDISLVIPVYNEEESLRPLWEALRPVLEASNRRWEVVLVDDGSKDASLERMRALRAQDRRVRVIRFENNRGQSAAFWCGFQHARAPILVTLDADLQNDPADIPLMLESLKDADMAIGWRHERRDPFMKRFVSKFGNAFRNWLTKEQVHDVGCSLKAFRREIVARMFPFRGMHRFYPTLARMAGFRVVEVKVRHHPRERGKSKYGVFNRMIGPVRDCFAVRWMKQRYVGHVQGIEVDHG